MLLVQHQPDTAMMSAQCDALGRCAVHPFVQIRRKSTRTGQWKELLESCPLCAMDGRSSASVSGGSSVCSASSRGAASTGGMADRSDRSGYGSSSSEENDGLDGSRRSRVSFHGEAEDEADDIRDSVAGGLSSLRRSLGGGGKDTSGSLSGLAGLPDAGSRGGGGVVDLSSRSDDRERGGGCGGSVVSSGARSALKRPKYKVCKDLMRQQLDDSNRVPKMSEDLDIDVESDDEDGPDKDALVPTPRVDDDSRDGREEEDEGEEGQDEEPADLPETRRTGSNGGQAKASSFHGHGSGRERRPPPRQSASFHADTSQGRHQQQTPASFHGNPESDRAAQRQQPRQQQQPQRRTDGGSGRASGGSSQSSSQSSSSRQAKSTRSSRSKRESKGQQRSASCHAGIRTPASIEPEGTRPDPEEFPCGQSRSSRDSRSGSQQQRGSRGNQQLAVVSPSGAVTPRTADAVQSARPATSSGQPGVAPPPPRPEYNMIIRAPKNFKDDVSTLSFMGSVSTPPPPPAAQGGGQRMSNIGEEDECDEGHGDDDDDDDADRIDTNEFDKKGRCVRHKHVRLRKKVSSSREDWKT